MTFRLLDTFCKAGGASVGYHRAGFEVVGVDIEPQKNYPYEFHQGDALEYIRDHGHEFDAIAASPPCQRYSTITANPDRHPDMIDVTRDALIATGRTYIIENVAGAAPHMRNPLRVCGSTFGLAVRRHRMFESNAPLRGTECRHAQQGRPIGVYGDHMQDDEHYRRPDGTRRGNKAKTIEQAREARNIDWMNWLELTQAIPPAYTQYLGYQLATHLQLLAYVAERDAA